jgi:hypothetical protein
VLLGGVSIDDRLVSRLAETVEGPLENKLTQALVFRAKVVALTREEKSAILAALERTPGDLQDVRELLLADEQWRLRRRL